MNADNLKTEEVILAHDYKIKWLRANGGVFAQVARQLSRKRKCSRQFVRLVYWGKRRSLRVERAFVRMRAPGFERGKAA